MCAETTTVRLRTEKSLKHAIGFIDIDILLYIYIYIDYEASTNRICKIPPRVAVCYEFGETERGEKLQQGI